MRLFQIGLLCLFILLQYRLWFGKNGVQDYSHLQYAVTTHQKINEKLLKRNIVLQADISDLKVGLEGVEERARNELGLIKPNETFFRLLPKKNN
jgi:cell division protein FtsB